MDDDKDDKEYEAGTIDILGNIVADDTFGEFNTVVAEEIDCIGDKGGTVVNREAVDVDDAADTVLDWIARC